LIKVKLTENESLTHKATFIFDLLDRCLLNYGRKGYILDILQRILQYFGAQPNSPRHHNGAELAKLSDFIQVTNKQQNQFLK
jgi:hypothetical protein